METVSANKRYIFTSESVTEGHPDKLCDQVADAVLDALLTEDSMSRVACEAIATTGMVLVCGEITTQAFVDIHQIVRDTVRNIGYTDATYGFEASSCGVMTSIQEQSPDIAMGVDKSWEKRDSKSTLTDISEAETGAGDQGMMFGFACDETDSYMPLPLDLSHKLCRRLAEVRKQGLLKGLRPDGKAQVSVIYEGYKPVGIDTVVVSTQHDPDYEIEQLREDVKKHVIHACIPKEMLTDETKIFINPTGRFVVGGPHGDTGLTGRKIIVDTYGGMAAHGGGSFSGKDPTKVDRSASYMARYIAKNIVAAGLASRIQVQLAYSIGVAYPVSINVQTYGTSKLSDRELVDMIKRNFKLTPDGIIKSLDLRRPIYKQTAAYGHFGRNDLDLPWEKLDKVEALRC